MALFIKKDEDELLSKLPHWHYLYKFNYENSNFYFFRVKMIVKNLEILEKKKGNKEEIEM